MDIDDELLMKASTLTGAVDHSAVVDEGLKALIHREIAKRLARLGRTQRALKPAPRRQAKDGK